MHKDAPTTTGKPDGLVAAPPVLAWSDAHKATASDVDAVSASKGGEFKEEIQAAKGIQAAYDWHDKPGGLFPGNVDGANYDACNLDIKSWQGIGFYNTCPSGGIQGRTAFLNVRSGNFSTKGSIGAAGNISAAGLLSSSRGRFSGKPEDLGQQGLHTAWNESGGQGEGNIIVNAGTGAGGLHIRIVNGDNTKQLGEVTISGDGSLNTGGQLKEAGQSAYSLNNPPTRLDGAGVFKDKSTGFIMQWGGGGSSSSNTESHNFNIAFPNGVFAVMAILGVNINGGQTIYATPANNSGFNYKASGAALGFTWIAIGY